MGTRIAARRRRRLGGERRDEAAGERDRCEQEDDRYASHVSRSLSRTSQYTRAERHRTLERHPEGIR